MKSIQKSNEKTIKTTRKAISFAGISTSKLGFRPKVTRVEVLQNGKCQNIAFFLTLDYLFSYEFYLITFSPNLYNGRVEGKEKYQVGNTT